MVTSRMTDHPLPPAISAFCGRSGFKPCSLLASTPQPKSAENAGTASINMFVLRSAFVWPQSPASDQKTKQPKSQRSRENAGTVLLFVVFWGFLGLSYTVPIIHARITKTQRPKTNTVRTFSPHLCFFGRVACLRSCRNSLYQSKILYGVF